MEETKLMKIVYLEYTSSDTAHLYIYEKFKCTKCGGGRVICKVYKIPKVRYSFI